MPSIDLGSEVEPVSESSASRQVRLLVLVPRSLMPEQVGEAVEKVKMAMTKFLGRENLHFKDSVTWYKEQFGSCGNWDSWVWETVTGKDYGTREPYFNGFVVYGERLGRASACIVDLALRSNRAVLALRSDLTPIEMVRGVASVDETDMVAGWKVDAFDPAGDSP